VLSITTTAYFSHCSPPEPLVGTCQIQYAQKWGMVANLVVRQSLCNLWGAHITLLLSAARVAGRRGHMGHSLWVPAGLVVGASLVAPGIANPQPATHRMVGLKWALGGACGKALIEERITTKHNTYIPIIICPHQCP